MPIARPHPGILEVPVTQMHGGTATPVRDALAVEAPLEMRLGRHTDAGYTRRRFSITMRTPGHDAELVLGFLYAEGVLQTRADATAVYAETTDAGDVVTVDLAPGCTFDDARMERHVLTTSSCGVCGKTSLEALDDVACPRLPGASPVVTPALLQALPARLAAAQDLFQRTGGLHAAALFAADGTLRAVREDVGRHNALDKLVGACLDAALLPLHDSLLLVSGRASFELVQKALRAGLPVMAAVGAPSSLAVDLARNAGMTLLGFLRDDRFNVYSGAHRLGQDG